MDKTIILEGKRLSKHFGSLRVINGVDLKISKGTIHSIIGPNGAGKTTLFNLLSGFLPVTEGDVYYKGEKITNLTPFAVSRRGIARSFQITSIFPDLSVHENVRIASQSKLKGCLNCLKHYTGLPEAAEKADGVLEFIGLVKKRDIPSKNLPYGEKRILDIGISLATSPDLLLLDEPMAGLQSGDLQWMMKLVQEISKTITVVLIDHNIDLIISISDRVTVLNQGQVIAEGNPAEIQADKRVQEAYLGGY
jgi:branched-chain amino acid transport system ATP-binding protein